MGGMNQIGAGVRSNAFPTVPVNLVSGEAYAIPSGQYLVTASCSSQLEKREPGSQLVVAKVEYAIPRGETRALWANGSSAR